MVELAACDRVVLEWAERTNRIQHELNTTVNVLHDNMNRLRLAFDHRHPHRRINEEQARARRQRILEALYGFNTLIAGVNSVLHESPDGMACGADPSQLLRQ